MAQIVLGLGASHSPMLVTFPDLWHVHVERDKRNPELWASDGKPHSYEELLAGADPAIAKELTPEKFQARYNACQTALNRLGGELAKVSPDALLIIGDDQHEVFHDNNMPAISVYGGETVQTRPRASGTGHPLLINSYRAHGEMDVKTYPVASALAKHLIEHLIEEGFDVAHSRYLKEGEGIGHAIGFVCRQLMKDKPVPIVPLLLNTFFPHPLRPDRALVQKRAEPRKVSLEEVRDWVSRPLDVLTALLEKGRFPFRAGDHCRHCPYSIACRRAHVPSQERVKSSSAFAAYFALHEADA